MHDVPGAAVPKLLYIPNSSENRVLSVGAALPMSLHRWVLGTLYSLSLFLICNVFLGLFSFEIRRYCDLSIFFLFQTIIFDCFYSTSSIFLICGSLFVMSNDAGIFSLIVINARLS